MNREGGKYLQSKSLLEFAVGPSLGLALLLQSVFSASNVFEFALHGGNFCSLEISIERSVCSLKYILNQKQYVLYQNDRYILIK